MLMAAWLGLYLNLQCKVGCDVDGSLVKASVDLSVSCFIVILMAA